MIAYMNILFNYVYNYFRGDRMNLNRIQSILNNKEKIDIFYDDRPVWIQGVNKNIAKVGFIDNFEERDVFIEDLYERNLYN